MVEFEGLVAVVTGGSSGIGAATVDHLRMRGAIAVVLDLTDRNEMDEAHEETCDVTDTSSVAAAVSRVGERFGAIDIVVNSAGIGPVGDICANSDDEWRTVFDVNVLGAARVSRAALPYLLQSHHAAIVNVASALALVGVPQRTLYSATKGALVAMTIAMAADHVASGIRVNAVAPGTTDTPWVSRLLATSVDPEAAARSLTQRQPLGRLVTAEEVAHAIAYLASPQSASTTGEILRVDGGLSSLRLPTAT